MATKKSYKVGKVTTNSFMEADKPWLWTSINRHSNLGIYITKSWILSLKLTQRTRKVTIKRTEVNDEDKDH
jgi:hypothetical protein